MEIRFYAAARAAAGRASATVGAPPATLGELLADLAAAHPGRTPAGTTLAEILPACSFLADGRRIDPGAPLAGVARLDVMPPFAGG
ncbi:MoaD/ThiS family protein [Corynebacterium sphenisci]|uniref:MoaD/ThiS family protein n=1 Tax=Corynebacterium sphenisci TaxID=191493 RepID=UPI0026DF6098|nr:MoaD/ThiS family protein [Corynebacterium sphenisci]MDO5731028.1 MoaD/ThiS family protein [Corynebacterium sphenisci]